MKTMVCCQGALFNLDKPLVPEPWLIVINHPKHPFLPAWTSATTTAIKVHEAANQKSTMKRLSLHPELSCRCGGCSNHGDRSVPARQASKYLRSFCQWGVPAAMLGTGTLRWFMVYLLMIKGKNCRVLVNSRVQLRASNVHNQFIKG